MSAMMRVVMALTMSLLPARRSSWGSAMRAELAGIDSPAERRAFVAGCVRAVVSMPSVLIELVARLLLLVLAAMAVRRFTTASNGVLAEAAAALILLTVLSWSAARPGPLGPAAPGLAARTARVTGLSLSLLTLAWFLSEAAGGAPHDPAGWWVAGSAVCVCWIAWSALTAAGLHDRTLGIVTILSLGAWFTWQLSTLVLGAANTPAVLPIMIVMSTGVIPGLLRGRLGAGQAARAAAGAPVASALLIFATAAVTSLLQPDPRHEVMDPMAGLLVFTALMAALLLAFRWTSSRVAAGRPPEPGLLRPEPTTGRPD